MINCPTHYVHSSCGADAVYSRHAVNRSAELSIVHFVWGPKPWMKQLDGKPPRSVYPAVQADIPFANEYRAWVKDLLGEARTATYFLPGALEPLEHTATSPSLHEPPYKTCLTGSKRTRFVPLRPCDLPPPPVEEPPR